MMKKIDQLTAEDIASICDHTFLFRPEYYKALAKNGESPIAMHNQAFFNFMSEVTSSPLTPYAICVRPECVREAAETLWRDKKENIKIASVVGFPDGSAYPTSFKIAEIGQVADYVDEIDFVLNLKDITSVRYTNAANEMFKIAEECRKYNLVSKLILETSELNPRQIEMACKFADHYGINFVKTSTGFSSGGATPEALRIMKKYFSQGIKISGGVKKDNVYQLLEAASKERGMIDLDPMKIRIGESGLLKQLAEKTNSPGAY